MAINFLQIKLLRGALLVFLLLLTACIPTQPFPTGIIAAQPVPTPAARPPIVGQEWVYNVRNVFNQELVDVVTERVVTVGEQIRIQRSGAKAGALSDEVQSPWGYVLQEPHWNPAQQFVNPIPVWPLQLTVGWNQFYKTGYRVLGYPDGTYYWGVDMKALQWEQVQAPAGDFLTLHYHNAIPYFASQDIFRVGNARDEDVWFSPEIGRWVFRRTSGRYITNGVSWSDAYWEDFLQWELVSWK